MANWSLVCFTLLTQSAVGLVWVGVAGRWFANWVAHDLSFRPMAVALLLTILGLATALVHLSKPGLAPKALHNLATSWLSREVLLVQAFAVSVASAMLLSVIDTFHTLFVMEGAACLLGGAALFAMAKVYLIKTVPMWNSPATVLEFTGSALLLGGSLGSLLISFVEADFSVFIPKFRITGIEILIGLNLKLLAIFPGLRAHKASLNQTWYDAKGSPIHPGIVLAIRFGLYLAGLVSLVAAHYGDGPPWLWLAFSLACIGSGEIAGRHYFYSAYRRIGL